MKQKKIMLGMYSQIPLGTPEEDKLYLLHHCYKPLLTYLYAHEQIKFIFYLSHTILEWFETDFPEINMLIFDMVKRKQLELLAGGVYDPIFSILPLKDRARQLEQSITYIRKRFGRRPKSAWITEQIWSPNLVTTLYNCGIQNVVINTDDGRSSGAGGRNCPFRMQELDSYIHIYPIDRDLSMRLFGIDERGELLAEGKRQHTLPVIMMDMEMLSSEFILGTNHQFVGLLERITKEIEKRQLTTILPFEESSETEQAFPRGYLPEGCYRFTPLPGKLATFNELFIRYPEMNFFYGRLCYSQKLAYTIKKEKSLKKLIAQEILQGESFGAFTHNHNGGIYLNNLRKENYRHVIEAEKSAREKGIFSSSLHAYDFDFDGRDEYIYRGKNITAIVDAKGGSIAELDYLVTSWNYLDTFTGHEAESTPTALKLKQNGRKQNSFIDVIMPAQYDVHEYDKNGPDVVAGDALLYKIDKLDRQNRSMIFSAEMRIPGRLEVLLLTKEYNFRTNSIEVGYSLQNIGDRKVQCKFACEQNISFAYDGTNFVELISEDSHHTRKVDEGKILMYNVKKLVMLDHFKRTKLNLISEKRFSLLKNHYNTKISTFFGEQDIYQFTMLLPVWDITLNPREKWRNSVELRIEKK